MRIPLRALNTEVDRRRERLIHEAERAMTIKASSAWDGPGGIREQVQAMIDKRVLWLTDPARKLDQRDTDRLLGQIAAFRAITEQMVEGRIAALENHLRRAAADAVDENDGAEQYA